uniref:Pyroglutamyl-peptidase I like n=1 Tax=Astyanax mexicanus TaxID=7994 RepID=A0A8B9LFC3_ASTMX
MSTRWYITAQWIWHLSNAACRNQRLEYPLLTTSIPDVCGSCPANNCCVEGGADQLDSIIGMRSLAKHLKGLGLDVIYSRDAGRYLCDFVYYCSLHYGQRRAAFIHVPASGNLARPEILVPQLQAIMQALLRQMDTLRTSPTASECQPASAT